jgi:hypothetical protein
MKRAILAATLLAVGATAASAQFGPPRPWSRDQHPYAERRHTVCQEKAIRLHDFDRRALADGRLSWRERRIHDALKRDLDRTCGGFRHRL